MYRLITFAASIIMATALFSLFTKPTFEHVRTSQAEAAGYRQALADAERLNARISQLVTEKNNLPQEQMEKLDVLIPEKIDEVATVMTLDKLAAKHFMIFSDIAIAKADLTDESDSNNGAGAELPTRSVEDKIDATAVKFSVSGTYEDFRGFVSDIEATLSLMDVADLSLTGEDSEKSNEYIMTILIYHAKKAK